MASSILNPSLHSTLMNKLNKPHSQIRNTNEQGAIWTLKWKGGKHHYEERDGMVFVGGRVTL